ncbi:MAG TPA: tetratricopeptide repeat protein [Flavobacteriales bacterium]|nr:tetratricopeptide repeat protein [Flavobacteriales bacterium]
MRLIYFVLLTFGCAFNFNGFTQDLDQQIRSIESSGNDSTNVYSLSKLAIKTAKDDMNAALRIVSKALVYSKNKPGLEAECYVTKGTVLRENFKINDAVTAYEHALKIYQKQSSQKLIASTCQQIAMAYKKNKEYKASLPWYKQAIDAAKKNGEWQLAQKCFKGCADAYVKLAANEKALEVLFEQLNYAAKSHSKDFLAISDADLDIAYHQFKSGNYPEALKHALASEEWAQKTNDNLQLLDCYNTIGACYNATKNLVEAIKWYEKAIAILEKTGENKNFLGNIYTNTGVSYYELGDYEKGLDYKKRGLKICQELNDHECIMNNFIAIGIDLVEKDKNYKEGIVYLKQAEALAEEHGSMYSNQYIYKGLYQSYNAIDDHKNAFEYLQKYQGVKDTMMSTEKQGQMSELEAKYESGKKQDEIELLNRNRKIQELVLLKSRFELDKQMAENANKANSILLLEKDKTLKETSLKKKEAEALAQKSKLTLLHQQKKLKEKEIASQRNIIYFFIGGFGLLVVLLFTIYRGYRNKQKANIEISLQKQELQLQKDIVDQKNREILDSINYAKRLQDAILPSESLVKEQLPASFILYKPKDIVAGDFYFLETLGDYLIFAACDCTGHGVPGSLVSVVCSNALNRAIKEFKLTDPGKILDKVRELVVETFEKSESEVKDGMDISLCVLNKTTRELKWAGANNPLLVVRANEKEVISPDKMPVGKHTSMANFTTHGVSIKGGDTIYLFTDGYADQFGGPKGKKFKASNMLDLIFSVRNEAMDQQKNSLETAFEKWRGQFEQLDDVCVMGIRI